MGGAERYLVSGELSLVLWLVSVGGPRLATLTLAALIVLVVHPVLRKAAAYDPQLSRVFFAQLKYQPFYPARAALGSRPLLPRPWPT